MIRYEHYDANIQNLISWHKDEYEKEKNVLVCLFAH